MPKISKESIVGEEPREEAIEGVKRATGLAEAGLTLGSALLGYPIAVASGLGKAIFDIWRTGGKDVDFEDAEEFMYKVMQHTVHQPSNEFGQFVAQTGAVPLEGTLRVIDEVIERTPELKDDPQAKAAARMGVQGLLVRYAPKMARSFGKWKGKLRNIFWATGTDKATNPLVQKIVVALKTAKPARGKQEVMYSKEWGRRFAKAFKIRKEEGGEAGHYKELGQLKGKMKKVQWESLREKPYGEKIKGVIEATEDFKEKYPEAVTEPQVPSSLLSQAEIDSLINMINESPYLSQTDVFSARTGLLKLIGKEGEGGGVPQTKEIVLLNRVFGKEFTQTILSKRKAWKKIKDGLYEVANIPRSFMASYDLSAPFRQGVFLIGRPQHFFKAFFEQFKYFKSEKAFQAIMDEISQHPDFELYQRGGLALTEMDSMLGLREERFASHWAEAVPGIRQSGRAYAGFLNKLRANVMSDLIRKSEKLGLKPRKNDVLLQEIGKYVNAASGRGGLGALENSAVFLNATLFSPRLMASRLKLLNPTYYLKAFSKDPNVRFVRRQALRDLFIFTTVGMTMIQLAKLGGAEVSANPLNSDFGKIKIGNTRIDVWGGFQQYARSAAQFLAGKTVSATTGRITRSGEGYKPWTRMDVLTRWLEYKQAPVMSFATDLVRGQTTFGEPFTLKKEVTNRMIPMVVQDVIEIAKEDPDLIPLSTLGVFGFGLQTFGKKPKGRYPYYKKSRGGIY